MLRVFRHDILDPDKFVITLELVPSRESKGRKFQELLKVQRDFGIRIPTLASTKVLRRQPAFRTGRPKSSIDGKNSFLNSTSPRKTASMST